MGHSDYDTTNSYYVHIDDEWKLQECRKVEQQIDKAKNKKKVIRNRRKKRVEQNKNPQNSLRTLVRLTGLEPANLSVRSRMLYPVKLQPHI